MTRITMKHMMGFSVAIAFPLRFSLRILILKKRRNLIMFEIEVRRKVKRSRRLGDEKHCKETANFVSWREGRGLMGLAIVVN